MATKTKKTPLTNRKPAVKKGENEVSSKKIFEIPVNKIEVENGFNKRLDYGSEDFETLKHSIKKHGVQEPIRVIPHPSKKDHYILREGHRRMRAVELINKATGGHVKKVLAMVSTKETKEKSLIRMISANSGKPFSKIERGFVCLELKNNGWTVNQIAEETGISITDIYFCMNLTNLPKKYHSAIAKGELSASKLSALFKEFESNPEKAEKIVEQAVKRAEKEEAKNEKEGKVSKKVKQAKVTGKHFKGAGSTSSDRQKIYNAIKMAEKNPDIYDSKKVMVVSMLHGLLDSKATEQEIANMMKK